MRRMRRVMGMAPVVALGIALVSSTALAQMSGKPLAQPCMGGMQGQQGMGSMGGMKGTGGGMDVCAWKSSLTPEQRMRMAKMHLELKKEMLPLKMAKKTKKVELYLLLIQDKPDRKAIHKKIGEIAELKQKMMEKKIAHKLEVRQMLSPDQRGMFDMHLLRKAEKGHMRGGMKGGMHGGMKGGMSGGMMGGGMMGGGMGGGGMGGGRN